MNATGFSPRVSWFPRAAENLPERDIPAADFIVSIQRGQHRREVEAIRQKFARALGRTNGDRGAAKKSVDSLKKRLPAVTFSGVFGTRSKVQLQRHSGLLQADLDLLGDRLPEIRGTLQADPHVYALFVSPTGDGIKAIYRVEVCADQSQHAAAHDTVAAHVKTLCGLDIDATSDIDRLCFTSFDPEAWLNPAAVELPTVAGCEAQLAESAGPATTPKAKSQTVLNLSERQRIAEQVLGSVRWEDLTTGFCECPGKSRHTNGDGEKDCKVWIEGAPSIECMHKSCRPIVEGVNHALRSAIGKAEWTPAKARGVVSSPNGETETEFEFANRLAAVLPSIKTCGNRWHAYQSGTWQEIERATLRPEAQNILPPNIRTARREATLLDHLEGRFQTASDSFAGFYKLTAAGMILLNVGNGVVMVNPSGEVALEPHLPDHLFTHKLAANFDPAAEAPLFARVLGEALSDPADQALLQLCAGNFLLPDCRFETALVCYGEAGRGKSTIAEAIAEALGWPLVPRLTMSQICDPKSYHVPKLKHAAVNLGTELDAVELGDSATFKAIVSGEPIEARPIYGTPFTMQTSCKLWFLANSLPRFKHGTEAELRRTRFLRFDYLPPQKDVTLKAKLARERDGVFSWMLAGLVELLNLPLIPLGGRHSREVHARFKISNDPVGAFVSAHCHMEPTATIAKDTLRNAFKDFCERNDLPASMDSWFLRTLYERWPNLREARPREDEGQRRRVITGIQLKS